MALMCKDSTFKLYAFFGSHDCDFSMAKSGTGNETTDENQCVAANIGSDLNKPLPYVRNEMAWKSGGAMLAQCWLILRLTDT